jgi:hypothetical protein
MSPGERKHIKDQLQLRSLLMKIECYMSTGYGAEEPLRANVKAAVEMERIDTEVIFRRITDDEALSLGLRGSPSVLINGVDIEPQELTGFS